MSVTEIGKILDTILPDPAARAAARRELRKLQRAPDTRLTAVLAEAQSPDPWTRRARPAFLYVMYALLLWSIPMGLIAAVRPDMAAAIARGMSAYLNGIPDELYALFGTGYLGYTAARAWGKSKGMER
jgi:hypothetical protein